MATRIQLRRGTAAQWETANPILAAIEIGGETDTGKFKIGDGTTRWDDLPYAAMTPSEVADALGSGSSLLARKTADQAMTSSTTPVADNHLALTLQPATWYTLDGMILYRCGSDDADMKLSWVGPGGVGVEMYWSVIGPSTALTGARQGDAAYKGEPSGAAEIVVGTSTASGRLVASVKGLIYSGDTGGTLTLYWAQNISVGSVLTLFTGSYIRALPH